MTAETTAPRQTSLTDWIWLLLPYALLVATTGHAVFGAGLNPDEVPRVIAAGLVLVLWHTYWAIINRQWLERTLAPMAVYYLGLIALSMVLLKTSFSFFGLYLSCYPMAFVALPGAWAYAGLAVATLTPLVVPGALDWTGSNLLITLAGLTLAAFVGWSIRKLEAETRARKAALVELSTAHAELERALAENIALQGRLVAEAHQSGVATERSRIAAEIHDTLAAALTGIVSQLEALDAELSPDDPIRTRVRTSTELARESLGEARHSIQALRPTLLVKGSLERALGGLLQRFERAHGGHARLHVTGNPIELPEDVEDALERIAREALTNAGRHAGATQVHLTLSYLDDTIALDVADDGAGFDPQRPYPGGRGLAFMAERVQTLGGDLDLRSGAGSGSESGSGTGAGTTVTATVPLPGRSGDARASAPRSGTRPVTTADRSPSTAPGASDGA